MTSETLAWVMGGSTSEPPVSKLSNVLLKANCGITVAQERHELLIYLFF